MNYLDDIKPLEISGRSDSDIADALVADTRHKRDIVATAVDGSKDLLGILVGKFHLLRLGSDATWKGPIVDAVAASGSAELIAGFEMLLTQLQISNRRIYTHNNAEQGAIATALTKVGVSVLNAAGRDGSLLQSAMDELTGGRLFAGVTADDVTSCRVAYLAEQSRAAMESEWVTLQNESINQVIASGDRKSFAVALRAAADAIEAG